MKRAFGPEEGVRKWGRVNRAQKMNWANVIRGPVRFGLDMVAIVVVVVAYPLLIVLC